MKVFCWDENIQSGCKFYKNGCNYKGLPKIFSSTAQVIKLWKYVDKFNQLPFPGAIVDQPAKVLEMLWIIYDQLDIEQEQDRKLFEKGLK